MDHAKAHATVSRRQFVTATAAASVGAFAGCARGDASGEAGVSDATIDAIEQEAVPVELTADGLDAVAERLAEAPVVGLGEHSHGIREFKTIPRHLVPGLVVDHGYRLVAMEGTLGDFATVDAYVAGGDTDLESALAALDYHFWRTEEVRTLFERLREFNDGRPESDRVVVRGYDAQYYDANAKALRSYLADVDPAYLSEIEGSLDPLTTDPYERDDAEYATDSQMALLDDLEARLEDRRGEYVAVTSESAWRLAKRHAWTLERGLRFLEHSSAHEFPQAKEVRDRAMAENVSWLREWTGADRAVVLGSVNHTARGAGHDDGRGTRMGQHLTDEFGEDYYSLGLAFGTGEFAAPANHERTEFETFDLDGPVEGTLEAALAEGSHASSFLDFEAARDRSEVDAWLSETAAVQVSVPRQPREGALPLEESPEDLLDGVVFVREASPASFTGFEEADEDVRVLEDGLESALRPP